MAPAEPGLLRVEVVYCAGPGQVDRVALQLNDGARLKDAITASGLCARHGLEGASLKVGIWGRVLPGETMLRDRDRVEIYRPLRVDPKEARRQRYRGKQAIER